MENGSLARDGCQYMRKDLNEYYVEDLKQTIQQIDKILETTDFTKEEICYFAWW